ncbi:MAG: NTP transferase domain-containing protein, partial [Burkholderiales bacterium]
MGGEGRQPLRAFGLRSRAAESLILDLVGLLLAAGSGSRFGSDKLRHRLPHGVPIAVQSARHLRTSLARVIAVVRPGAHDTARALAAEGCEVVPCHDAEQGMGASL